MKTWETSTFIWNLCGTWNLVSLEPSKCGTGTWGTWTLISNPVEPLSGALQNLNLYLKPLWNLEPFNCGTIYVEPLGNLSLYMEPFCYLEPFECGTFMCNKTGTGEEKTIPKMLWMISKSTVYICKWFMFWTTHEMNLHPLILDIFKVHPSSKRNDQLIHRGLPLRSLNSFDWQIYIYIYGPKAQNVHKYSNLVEGKLSQKRTCC